MYCYKCGKYIEENVNFCPNCGASIQQQNINVTISKKKEKHFEKNIFGVKITKEVVGVYLVWLTFNIILFLVSLNSVWPRNGFWPITFSVSAYDYLELIIYLIVPCIIYLVVNIYKRSEEEWEIDPNSKIKKVPLIVALPLIVINILYFYELTRPYRHDSDELTQFIVIGGITRLVVISWVVMTAKELKRLPLFWAIFAFISPTLSLIAISLTKRIRRKAKVSVST